MLNVISLHPHRNPGRRGIFITPVVRMRRESEAQSCKEGVLTHQNKHELGSPAGRRAPELTPATPPGYRPPWRISDNFCSAHTSCYTHRGGFGSKWVIETLTITHWVPVDMAALYHLPPHSSLYRSFWSVAWGLETEVCLLALVAEGLRGRPPVGRIHDGHGGKRRGSRAWVSPAQVQGSSRV